MFPKAQKNRSKRTSSQLRRRRMMCESLEDRRLMTATIGNNIGVGTQLNHYRLAIAATAEYTAYFGGQTGALAQVQSFVADINAVFEKEFAVHLDLVSGTNTLFTNAATDGYTNGDQSVMINENTPILNSVLGNAAYDIGHVLGTASSAGGGLAQLGSVNDTTGKGRGASVSQAPVGQGWFNVVIHELAHQFGAAHTFNANAFASAIGNRTASNAYEPASGSTLMSYAGISGADNLQSSSDPYFHAASFEQVQEFIAGAGTPNSTSPISNATPAVNGGSNYTIPAQTPFALTAVGSDTNAGDTLTYTWEQLDLGAAMSLPLTDNGSSPLFRAFEPTTTATRVFPRLEDLVNNVNTAAIGEKLPTTTRSLNFRTTVRDGQNGVNSDDVLLNVVDTGTPFAVTSPNTATNWTGGTSQTIAWNVAGTTGNGINTADVGIDLSLDGGLTYPFVLAASTPNDGTETLTVPNFNASEARVRVRGIGNVFFDISDANFTITANASVPGITVTQSDGSTIVGEAGLLGGQTIDTYQLARTTSTAGTTTILVSADSQTELSIDGTNFSSSIAVGLNGTTAATVYVRGFDDTAQEGIHYGNITHVVSASADPNYTTSMILQSLSPTIADDELQPVIGVDLDRAPGQAGVTPPDPTTPTNWTRLSDTFGNTTASLLREDGIVTGVGLTVTVSGAAGLNRSEISNPPLHYPSLEGLEGNHLATESLSLTWTGLTPGTDYNIYLMTSEWFSSNSADQEVSVTAGITVPNFSQDTSSIGSGMLVNGGLANVGKLLEADALTVQAGPDGKISIKVTDTSAGGAGDVILSGAAIQEVGPDIRGFNMVQTGGSTGVSEAGTSDTFAVTLKTQPTGDVVISTSTSDSGEVAVSPASLTFNASNWNVPQTVTVTGVDDALPDGGQTAVVMLAITPTLTLDNAYDSVGSRLLNVLNDDNEGSPLVGVDFESPTAPNNSPTNWTTITGSFGSTDTNLINEDGDATAIDLAISIAGGATTADTSTPSNLPDHTPSLAEIAGLRLATTSITLTWSDLTPDADYNVWLFAARVFGNQGNHTVTITGGGTNPAPFVMDVVAAGVGTLMVNSSVASSANNLQSDAVVATANSSGQIVIVVSNTGGEQLIGLNGAAIQEVAAIPALTADLSVTTHGDEAGPVDIVYTVTLNSVNNTGIPITFDIADLATGTATSGADYTAIPANSQISVAPGTTTGTFTVDVINDPFEEPVETVSVQISNPSNASVVINGVSASANIADNDASVVLTLDTENTANTTLVGGWGASSSVPGFDGANYGFAKTGANATATFAPNIATAGQYEVFVKYSSHPNRASNASVSVVHADGTLATSVDQRTGGGVFKSLGLFNFSVGTSGKVVVNAAGSDGFVTADTVQFVRVGDVIAAPSADLAGPTNGQSLTAAALNADGFIDVTFYSTEGLDAATVTDPGGEFTISGSGVGTAVIDGTGVLQAGSTYRYSFLGSFIPGDINVNFTAGSFANVSTTGNLAEQESFTLTDGAVRITLDNTDATQVNNWAPSASTAGYVGPNYLYTNAGGAGRLVYTPTIPTDGSYEVFVNYTDGSSRASNAAYEVVSQNGTSVVRVDQRTGGGVYQSLGTFNFLAGTSGSVTLRGFDADGFVVGDAMQFVRVGSTTGAPTATLADPVAGASIVVTTINGQDYIDVTFNDTSGAGLNLATITDLEEEFTLSGAGAAAVTVNGAATLVSGTTYRYATTGDFSPGAVDAVFAAGTFADLSGNQNIDSIASFVVAEDLQEEVIVDNSGPGFAVNDPSSQFFSSSSAGGFVGSNYIAAPAGSTATATWTPTLANSGQQYQVYVRYTSHPMRATNATYVVTHDNGTTTTVTIDQTSGGGSWVSLGTFTLNDGTASVQLQTTGANQYVVADAVRFVLM
ncbi:reprolysin-like metallopeptidase [Novipirellula sp. SH528]|uniref:golvesin C-terminal-like domain-containing protein n=1 Tax=Novipirellula sp. SH528 TaxID=3454466 RepID=UPI003F9FB27D